MAVQAGSGENRAADAFVAAAALKIVAAITEETQKAPPEVRVAFDRPSLCDREIAARVYTLLSA